MSIGEHQPWVAMVAASVKDHIPQLPAKTWIDWAHLATTATIVIFLWGEYQSYTKENQDDVRRLAVLTAQVQAMKEIEEQRHVGIQKSMAEIDRRLDAQRGDIREVQAQLNSHIDRVNGNGR